MNSILFLAPLQEMAEAALSQAEQLGITIDTDVADDDHAVETVGRHPEAEVVVSRGGVGERVRSIEGISVIQVGMNAGQFLEAISRFSGRGMRRIAFVGRISVLGGISGDYRIGEAEVTFRSCSSLEEIERTLDRLQRDGIDVIIGCRFSHELAVKKGIPSDRLTTSALSIREALEEAVRLVGARETERLHSAQLRAIIDNIEEGVIAIDSKRQVSFCNNVARRVAGRKDGVLDGGALAELLARGRQEGITTVRGNPVLAKSIALDIGGKRFGEVITFQEASTIQTRERKVRLSLYEKGLYAKKRFADMLCASKVMQDLIEKAEKYARHDSNLLIYGETGTGKEVLAQSVHNASPRKSGPFVSVNTASLPPSLLESELFGYAEGAFTGAKKGGKPGLFELAHGGTIFLDEIGELAPDIQSRLLRVLQEKEIMRLGDDRIVPVDVRIISATNKDLFGLVRQGRFREDLYYRIYVLGLRLPPLRERIDDIPLLFRSCIAEIAGKEARSVSLTAGALDALREYGWPGNIRQLRNVAEVIAYCGPETVDERYVREILAEQETKIEREPPLLPAKKTISIKEMEADVLRDLLREHSPEEVCKMLGISRVTLWRKKKALLKG